MRKLNVKFLVVFLLIVGVVGGGIAGLLTLRSDPSAKYLADAREAAQAAEAADAAAPAAADSVAHCHFSFFRRPVPKVRSPEFTKDLIIKAAVSN